VQPGVIIAILAILVPLWVLLRHDFIKGLAFAIFFWVFMSTQLRVQFGDAIPAFTIHRLMLIVVAAVWLTRNLLSSVRSVPLIGCFVFWFLANLVSLAGTQIDFATSLKGFLDFVLEIFVFYVVASTSLKNEEDALRVLRAAWLGLVAVAFLAVVERHTGFNPVKRFLPGGEDDGNERMILATYQHRILLGTAMAMGVALSFTLLEAYRGVGRKLKFFWVGLSLLLAASYYGFSRGPWLGLMLACGIMSVMGSTQVRKKLVLIGVVAMVILVARPGVVNTLSNFAEDTFDKSSFKGGTAQYRLELWQVAFHEVSKSPWSFLFGCGPSAGMKMHVDWALSYRDEQYVVDSWDNHFAYALFQFGFVGLAATLLLYFKGLVLFFKAWRRSWPPKRHVLSGLLATAAVLVFMMTNVLIFAKQLHYLFWTVIASGFVIVQASDSLQPEPVREEEDDFTTEPASESVNPVEAY
jgi:O-antigen ligase